jgi:outer membrane protein TolC
MSRNGFWFAVLLIVGGVGCRQAEVRPTSLPPVVGDIGRQIHTSEMLPRTPPTKAGGSVILASYQAEEPPPARPPDREEVVRPPEILPPPAAGEPLAAQQVTLEAVIRSVLDSFPLLVAELAGRQVADGQAMAARGPYDVNMEMYSIAAPMGFYRNYRSGAGVKKALFQGGYVYSGYRIGRDDIQPWFKERLTNDAGEFKMGAGIPLLQGRCIDKYRADVMSADLHRASVDPQIQAELLQFVLAASDAYWSWVAAGKAYQAQTQLLRLATARVEQIEERVNSGDLERIALIDNRRLIASRENKLIEAERKLEAAAIKLSLFWRDAEGQPRVAGARQLPKDFPQLPAYAPDRLLDDIEHAWSARPELQILDLQMQQIDVQLADAANQLLPRIDARLEASKDVGGRADVKDDKTPFELEVGLFGEIPLQRRQARGKIRSLQGKLSQVSAKYRFTADKIEFEVRDAASALQAAEGRIERAQTTVDLARQTLDLGRQGFESGDLTLVTLNLYEKAVQDAELQLIEARADYFKAWAARRAAMGEAPSQTRP